MRTRLHIYLTIFSGLALFGLGNAQTASTSDNIVAEPIADRKVYFDVTDPGISKTVLFGADLAWINEQNFRRAVRFMGIDQVDVARVSFQPTYPLIDGNLQQPQLDDLNYRLSIVQNYTNPSTQIVMNADAPTVDPSYYGNAANWTNLLKATAVQVQNAGYTVMSIGPMNEPDYSTSQGSMTDFYNIVSTMRNDTFFDNIRISGGNVLNCDVATTWYNYMVPAGLNEGNTHQLAGTFDQYALFYQTVSGNGDWASNDELHNIMEAIVGYEYGIQMGIWWGAADLARGEMVKAFDGQRIGYAEHRPNWTVAAVYRNPLGEIKAFCGASERQAAETIYNYVSTDRAVYYDGKGPQRIFNLDMPGGDGYWVNQSNAERVINVTWGEDVQPYIDGQYILVNRSTGQVMQVMGSSNGSNIEQANYVGAPTQKWAVTPVDPEIGGDFSYYRIRPLSSTNKYMDLYNYSLDNGGNINLWDIGYNGNQQWYLDYAEDGWFYIRSRESSLCIQVSSTGNVEQWEKTEDYTQQWRLIPLGASIEFNAPAAPTNLSAIGHSSSVQLDWTANSESDLAGYTILRAETGSGEFNTIARKVTANSFVDNTVKAGVQYTYKIRAVDNSLNRSGVSNEVSATATGANDLVCYLTFDSNTQDSTIHLNHAAASGGAYVTGNIGNAISLDGSADYIQLSPDIANHDNISVSAWVNWAGSEEGEHLFEFTGREGEYMYLSPSINGQTKFSAKHNGIEETISAPALSSGSWTHVVVTLGEQGAFLYLNGTLAAGSTGTTIAPSDINSFINYIGINQADSKYFEGLVDDFRVYSYQLSANQISNLYNNLSVNQIGQDGNKKLAIWPVPADKVLFGKYTNNNVKGRSQVSVINMGGAMMIKQEVLGSDFTLDVSALSSGVYMLRLENEQEILVRKLIID